MWFYCHFGGGAKKSTKEYLRNERVTSCGVIESFLNVLLPLYSHFISKRLIVVRGVEISVRGSHYSRVVQMKIELAPCEADIENYNKKPTTYLSRKVMTQTTHH